MASTFSTNSDLEKPASGEQQGIWGDTLNRNTDKIDGKMNRVLRLNANSSVALTTSQTSVAQFDSQIVRCSGSLTANRTMIFPTGKQGKFTIDLADVTFSDKKFILKVTGDAGVTVTSASERIFGIYSTGTSIRRVGLGTSQNILNEIRMYAPASAGFTLPFGWYVCNGSNGTPDLRSKFVRGHSNMTATSTGGADTKSIAIPAGTVTGTATSVALTAAMIPNHYHYVAATGSGVGVGATSNLNTFQYATADGTGSNDRAYALMATATTANAGRTSNNIGGGTTEHKHTVTGTTAHANASSDVKPAYYALVFICYRGF